MSTTTTASRPEAVRSTPPSGTPASRAIRLFKVFSELAASSSSGPTRLGSSALSAGDEKAETTDCAAATANTTHSHPSPGTSRSSATIAACRRFAQTSTRLRFQRSTKTPATEPRTTEGASRATIIPAVATVDPVCS